MHKYSIVGLPERTGLVATFGVFPLLPRWLLLRLPMSLPTLIAITAATTAAAAATAATAAAAAVLLVLLILLLPMSLLPLALSICVLHSACTALGQGAVGSGLHAPA